MDYETELKMNPLRDTSLPAAIAELVDSVKLLTVAVQGLKKESGSKKKSISNNKRINYKDNINIYNSRERAIMDVVGHYKELHPKSKAGLNPKSPTYKAVDARLTEGYSVMDLQEAIDGMHKSPFHCGQNKQGTKFLSLELCMRNAEHVESFIMIEKESGKPKVSVNTLKTVEAMKSWLKED